jgi:hypothetical protein
MIGWIDRQKLAGIKSLMIDVQEILTLGAIESEWLKLTPEGRERVPRGVTYNHDKHSRLKDRGLLDATLVTYFGLPEKGGGRPINREMRATLSQAGVDALGAICDAALGFSDEKSAPSVTN